MGVVGILEWVFVYKFDNTSELYLCLVNKFEVVYVVLDGLFLIVELLRLIRKSSDLAF